MSISKEYEQDFILLLESGFIAVNQSDEDASTKLFKAAQVLKPESTLPKVGMGYLHLHKLEIKQAVELFETVLEKEPDNEMAKTFLGLCLSFTPKGVEKAEKILESTCKSKESLIQNLSQSALTFIDTFIKKSPTPVEGMKPTRKK